MRPNTDRNREIVQKRVSDQEKWSFEKLGEHYKLHKTTIEEIFKRDLGKYATKTEIDGYMKLLKKRRELSTS